MSKLILIRHGQSLWNAENRFTGWVDVDLSKKGIEEAKQSGELIKQKKIKIDVCFTSYLKRAIRTLTVILDEINQEKKFNASWEINERHYGSLTGLNKKETKDKIGEVKFMEYRRSWKIAPPPIDLKNNNISLYGPLNLSLPEYKIPLTESLKDTYERVKPYYEKQIKKYLLENKNVLIAAHGNSLRALCKLLFNIDEFKINELEIPTGNPMVIEFDKKLKITSACYLNKLREEKILINN